MTPNDLKNFLERHGLSYVSLATLLGVRSQTVYHWLRGQRQVSLTVARLLRMFDRAPELMKDFAA